MSNQKTRKHSGRCTPTSTIKREKKWIINNCLDPQEYWDDWLDKRDGMRNYYKDYTKIYSKKNQLKKWQFDSKLGRIKLILRFKLKREIRKRKAKKLGRSSSNI